MINPMSNKIKRNLVKMVSIDNLEIGRRYWIDLTQTISGVYEGVFATSFGELVRFGDIDKHPKYMGLYGEKNNGIEFRANVGTQYPEY